MAFDPRTGRLFTANGNPLSDGSTPPRIIEVDTMDCSPQILTEGGGLEGIRAMTLTEDGKLLVLSAPSDAVPGDGATSTLVFVDTVTGAQRTEPPG